MLASTLMNDILSVNKELEDGDINNSVIQKQKQRNCSVEEAMSEVLQMFNAELLRFNQNCQVLENGVSDENVANYTRGMRAILWSNRTFCTTNPRYTVANERAESLFVTWLREFPLT